MFTGWRKWLLCGLGLLLAAALVASMLTRETGQAGSSRKGKRSAAAPAPKLVDRSPLETANSLALTAGTADEQHIADEAVRTADHAVDLAFATALRQAQDNPPPADAASKQLRDRIHLLESRLTSVKQQADRLSKPAENDDKAKQQLEIAQARQTLIQDALEDAKQDLARSGGDPQAEIKHELEEHEALQHAQKATPGAKPVVLPIGSDLLAQFRQWRQLREDQWRVLQAQQAATAATQTLARKHQALEQGLPDTLDATDDNSEDNEPSDDQHAEVLANLHSLSDRTKTLAAFDRRIEAQKQLVALYGEWAAILDGQIRAALHAILRSLLWILLALIGIVVIEGIVERFYMRVGPDRRRLGTMRMVLRFVSQVIGVLVILLIVFGPPTQLSTILALAGAGLTVALKDFIVAFFGWFVLMGPQGIRRGDWVEIEGIGGEVVEVGLLRTTLLETGNWNDAGHPTGRRVSFVNTFAIERHYFNFTTAGQWLWDELDILIPTGEDPYDLTTSVLKLVTDETREDAALAEQEWQKVTHGSMVQTFNAAPAINVRPTNLGVNLIVRYVVNAHNRYPVRTRLYEKIVELLHHTRRAASSEPAPSGV